MSGICGIINFNGAPVEQVILQKMVDVSSYRGRDGMHLWIQDHVGLAYLALHTTPEATHERQPLVNLRSDLVLVADARVDNRLELIHLLSSKEFIQGKNPTDADLILAAYDCWGDACTEYIVGDFAFVIWDCRQQKLICARDPAGVKPLFYNYDRQTFRFGSDIKQVLIDPIVSQDLDGFALADALCYHHWDQARSRFASVQKIWPGRCVVIERGIPRSWRYWSPESKPQIIYKTDQEYVDHFRELFTRCVTDRTRSQTGAIAMMTSGGLDSPSIAAVANKLFTNGNIHPKPIAFTFFTDAAPESDERHYSLTLESELGIETHPISADGYPLIDEEDFQTDINSPFGGSSRKSRLSRELAAERGCDVYLRGDGGDELFHPAQLQYLDALKTGQWKSMTPWMLAHRKRGYSWLQILRIYFFWPFIPYHLQYWIDRKRGTRRFTHPPQWLHPELSRKTLIHQRLAQRSYTYQSSSIVRKSQYNTYVNPQAQSDSNIQMDILANKYGLETRYPFMDSRLKEFMFTSPIHLGAKPGATNTKWILRNAMKNILPDNINQSTHKTLGEAYWQNLVFQSITQLSEFFLDSHSGRLNLIDDRIVQNVIDSLRPNTLTGQTNLIPLLFVERWLRSLNQPRIKVRFDDLQPWQFE